MRRSERLRARRDDVAAFREAFTQLLETMERQPEGLSGYFYRWAPQVGREREANALKRVVAERAGPAADAIGELGFLLHIEQAPMFNRPSVTINPVMTWASALDPPNTLTVDDVIDTCDRAIGALDGRTRDAERVERSLAGRVARLTSFPSEVREAAGQSKVARTAAFTLAIACETMVLGTVASLLALLIAKLAGWA